MKIWVGVTDEDWFTHLSHLKPDEANFWQPSGARAFRALAPGEPFLFKLHSPKNFIVGGGFFVSHTALPASIAWDAFGIKNGVGSLDELHARIRRYRRETEAVDPVIGCTVLAEPFFLEEPAWLAVPSSWAPNIVQGKTYEAESAEGRALWQSVRLSTAGLRVREPAPAADRDEEARFGAEYLTRSRLGQGAFRVLVTDAYERRCAVTGERTLPVLEAAHIKPYALSGPHQVNNGILLRSDLHRLFDLGYVTITPDLRLEVSRRLKAEWQNGREYYAHHGQPLRFYPQEPSRRPSPEFLRWHNESRFRT
ncbi:MAG TPA: HNH endonuclease [Gemmatimonadales bacterium]|nr:HNH endonuclease [Gemmatimonadales bacterium]